MFSLNDSDGGGSGEGGLETSLPRPSLVGESTPNVRKRKQRDISSAERNEQ